MRTRSVMGVVAGILLAALIAPALAHAVGTGDDPTQTSDTLSIEEWVARKSEDIRYQQWLAAGSPIVSSADATTDMGVAVIDAPHYSLWTPSHKQERPYWCGPATAQIITHYWGSLLPQGTFAAFMGTTTNGTDFSVFDDCLRRFTGKQYYYYSGIQDWSSYCSNISYGLGSKHYPVGIDVKIEPGDWPNYEFAHAGHIMPIEGFDWRYQPYRVRVNDPYDETSIGGGATYGHVTYPAYVPYKGILAHFRHAVVR